MSDFNRQKIQIRLFCPKCQKTTGSWPLSTVYHCPQCDHLISFQGAIGFYYIEPVLTQGTLFYLPYWYFRGYQFDYLEYHIEKQWVDRSISALSVPELPVTLGVRLQQLEFISYSTKAQGFFIKPRGKKLDVLQKIRQLQNAPILLHQTLSEVPSLRVDKGWLYKITKNVFKKQSNTYQIPDESALMRQLDQFNFQSGLSEINLPDIEYDTATETLALLYYPFLYKEGVMQDGISGKNHPVSEEVYQSIVNRSIRISEPGRPVHTQCPKCKASMKNLTSRHYLCTACKKNYLLYNSQWIPCAVGFYPESDNEAVYLPFWKLAVTLNGSLEKRSMQKGKFLYLLDDSHINKIQLVLQMPAFWMSPHHFMRAALHLNTNKTKFQLKSVPDNQSLIPVSMELTEVVKILRPLIAELTDFHQSSFNKITEIKIRPQKAMTVYLPFIKEGVDLVQKETGLTIGAYTLRIGSPETD